MQCFFQFLSMADWCKSWWKCALAVTVTGTCLTNTIMIMMIKEWGLCALRHGIQISMEAILACHPARSTEWLDCHPKSCELWRIRTGPIQDRLCHEMQLAGAMASHHVDIFSKLNALILVWSEHNQRRDQWGAVRITSLNPKFNGSPFNWLATQLYPQKRQAGWQFPV